MSFDLKGLRILIADDSEPIRNSLKQILTPTGMRMRFAENGQEAYEMAKKQPGPQLILSDIEMPIMGGIELCSHIKNTEETKDIPVVFLSTLDNSKDILAGMRVGAADYISKRNFSEENLVRVLKRVIEPILGKTDASAGKAPPGSTAAAPPPPPKRVEIRSVRDVHLGMFDQARIGILVYSLRRELLFINSYAAVKLGVDHSKFQGVVAQDLLKEAIKSYEAGRFENKTFERWMSGSGAQVQYRLELLTNEAGEATSVVIFIE